MEWYFILYFLVTIVIAILSLIGICLAASEEEFEVAKIFSLVFVLSPLWPLALPVGLFFLFKSAWEGAMLLIKEGV